MSKAFTREDDEAPEPGFVPKIAPVPPGVKNYMTADGAARLREELEQLQQKVSVPQPAPGPEGSRGREMLRQRIAILSLILGSVTVVDPTPNPDRVKFGTWVRVRNSSGDAEVYRVVGIHETELGEDWISWISPLAKALLNRAPGEKAQVRLPRGLETLEILMVSDRPPE